jgi:hypothetical protein
MDVFRHCYNNNAFPIKTVHTRIQLKINGLLKESKLPAKECDY